MLHRCSNKNRQQSTNLIFNLDFKTYISYHNIRTVGIKKKKYFKMDEEKSTPTYSHGHVYLARKN